MSEDDYKKTMDYSLSTPDTTWVGWWRVFTNGRILEFQGYMKEPEHKR